MLFLQREFAQNVYIYRWPLSCTNETGCLETGNNLTGHPKREILLPPETKLNPVFSVQMITALEAIEETTKFRIQKVLTMI